MRDVLIIEIIVWGEINFYVSGLLNVLSLRILIENPSGNVKIGSLIGRQCMKYHSLRCNLKVISISIIFKCIRTR